MLTVMKFGGTSLADPGKILAAARKAAEAARLGQVVVVVSARGHTTDRLVEDALQITPDPDPREMDACLAAGEQMSAGLMAMALAALNVPAVSLTGWQAGIRTDANHSDANILSLDDRRIRRELREGKIVVVAGFQGLSDAGDITTLGRGGSDTTAVALAAFLQAEDCRIYTDVDGVYDKDPRKYPDAIKYSRIGYADMLAMAQQGAQVLHDKCVALGQKYGVPIRVLSSFRPGPGTLVTDARESFCPPGA